MAFEIKWRDNLWSRELLFAVIVMITCWIGMAISLAGLSELPKCKYGDPRCYFFVQVCDNNLFDTNTQSCVWMAKQRKTEGGTEDGLDQVTVPILASCLGILPGMALVVATAVKNERCLFSILEFGKMFIGFDIVLLIISCLQLDRLTWDCRWWGDAHHPDSAKCEGAYSKYVVGTTFIFVTEFLLLIGSIVYAEMERKRVNSDLNWFTTGDAGNTQTDAVQMNTRVNKNGLGLGVGDS